MTQPNPCPKCGKPHLAYDGETPGCAGHKSGQPDQPCRQRPIAGGTVCRNHGGATPQVRAAAARRLAEQEARKAVVTLGAPIETDPVDGMRQLIAWSSGHVAWYRSKVQELIPDALVWGQTEVRESDTQGLTVKQEAQVNAWLKLYNEERERLAKFCATAMQHGLAEREIRALEAYGDQIAAAMTTYAERLAETVSMTPEQLAAAVRLVPAVLREIEQATSSSDET